MSKIGFAQSWSERVKCTAFSNPYYNDCIVAITCMYSFTSNMHLLHLKVMRDSHLNCMPWLKH